MVIKSNTRFCQGKVQTSPAKLIACKPSCLGSSGKEFLPRKYSGNIRFDSQEDQRLVSTHAFMHELDSPSTVDGSETGAKAK